MTAGKLDPLAEIERQRDHALKMRNEFREMRDHMGAHGWDCKRSGHADALEILRPYVEAVQVLRAKATLSAIEGREICQCGECAGCEMTESLWAALEPFDTPSSLEDLDPPAMPGEYLVGGDES